jgi:hypothetical protein
MTAGAKMIAILPLRSRSKAAIVAMNEMKSASSREEVRKVSPAEQRARDLPPRRFLVARARSLPSCSCGLYSTSEPRAARLADGFLESR